MALNVPIYRQEKLFKCNCTCPNMHVSRVLILLASLLLLVACLLVIGESAIAIVEKRNGLGVELDVFFAVLGMGSVAFIVTKDRLPSRWIAFMASSWMGLFRPILWGLAESGISKKPFILGQSIFMLVFILGGTSLVLNLASIALSKLESRRGRGVVPPRGLFFNYALDSTKRRRA